MKSKNPGKIVMIPLLWMAMIVSLFAGSVTATLKQSQIFRGDTAALTITAEGEHADFPVITKIGDAPILGTSTAQSTTIINGQMRQSYSKTYTFAPRESVKIPSFNVKVDGRVYKTKPLELKVVKPTAAKAGAPFILEMVLAKKRAYVGEGVRLDLKFKQKRGVKADKIEITPPKLQNFWVKEIKGAKQTLEGDYIVQTYSYLLFPQKPGAYTIPAVVANIGTRVKRRGGFGGFSDPIFDDPFFQSFTTSLEWKKLFSNDAKLIVDPLPDNLEVYGHFKLHADVDKREVAAQKPVNLTITIEGEGNVDDIRKFDIDIPDAIVYADEPKIEGRLENGKYVGTFRQKIAIVAEHDFTIPPVTFTYFDSQKKQKVTLKSDPISIKVKGGAKVAHATAPKIEASPKLKEEIEEAAGAKPQPKHAVTVKESARSPYLWLLAGILIGAAGMWLIGILRSEKEEVRQGPKPILGAIRSAKSDRELYNLLLPYAKEGAFIEEILHKLEENLYKGAQHKIDRDEIVDYFEEVVLSAERQ